MTNQRRAGRDPHVAKLSASAEANAAKAAGQAEDILSAIELLPPERRGALTQILISQETYSGPIPSPRVLAGMDVVVPGSARQIVDMALSQQKFDHSYSDRILSSESNYRLITFIGAVVTVLSLITAAVIFALSHETAVAVTLGSVTGLSVLGRRAHQGTRPFPEPERRARAAAVERAPGRRSKPTARPEHAEAEAMTRSKRIMPPL